MAAARAAYVAGFATSSNLAARQRYGVPTAGTSAHSFTLLHDSEADAFRAQVSSLGAGHHAARRHLRHPRGRAGRRRDRRAGARGGPPRLRRPRASSPARCAPSSTTSARPHTRIVVTSDLDEFAIAALASAPVDAYGVGTAAGDRLGPSRPAASSTSWCPARTTTARWSRWRRRAPTRSRSGAASTRCAAVRPPGSPRPRWSGSASRPSTTATTGRCWCRWCATARSSAARPLDDARARHLAARPELPPAAQQMSRGEPVIPTIHV